MSVQGEIDRINQNVANTYAVLSALGADMPTEQNSDNLAPTAGTAKAVLYSAQTLTDEEKTQARTNIGAAAVGETGGSGAVGTQFTATIPASGWGEDANGYQSQTVTVTGLKGTYTVNPSLDVVLSGTDPEADNEILAAFGLIAIAYTGTNSLTVKCIGDPPTVNIPVVVAAWE